MSGALLIYNIMGYSQKDVQQMADSLGISMEDADKLMRGRSDISEFAKAKIATDMGEQKAHRMRHAFEVSNRTITMAEGVIQSIAYMPKSKGSKRQLKTNYTPPKKKRK